MNKKGMNNFEKWVILIGSLIIAIYLVYTGLISQFISGMEKFKIIGVLISGIFFGYFFTAAPATVSLIYFTDSINPIIVAFIGAIGTMIGDLILFNFFKKGLPKEIENIITKSKLNKLKKSKFKWITFGIAGFIIASPLPDEIGISLLGVNKIDTNIFMLLAFMLNFIGILIITTIAWLV